jgi:hypothetical protein
MKEEIINHPIEISFAQLVRSKFIFEKTKTIILIGRNTSLLSRNNEIHFHPFQTIYV